MFIIGSNPVLHGVLFKGLSPKERSCMKTSVLVHKQEFVDEMDKWTKPLIIYKTNAADNAQNIFQPTTLMFMWYAAIVWIIIFVGFIIWEFWIWRPKHKRRKEMKKKQLEEKERENERENEMEKDPGQLKNNQTKASAEELRRNVLNLDQEKSREKNFIHEMHTNQAFVIEDRRNSDFQALIKRQNEELLQLQKKLTDIKLEWDRMVKEVQRRHRREQKVYLTVMNDDLDKFSLSYNDETGKGTAWPTICL